ncbi:MAG: YfhO family protein [Clostridia bacterium]|nr:YfhO family protein [Clostridia bacterium]
MDFSFEKKLTLKPKKEKALSTFLIGLFTACCIFVPFMVMSKGYFIFYGDFNVQQIPFYQMCHKAIKEGNVSWNWLTDLGANFIGSYGYYLIGSVFFWLTIPFPNSFVPYLLGPLLILKFALAALTAYCYIRRFTRTPEAARLGGLLYAFSGFSVYNIFFNSFHESIICFPLLLLGLEMLITENKRGVFALSVALCAAVNYFFFFGMVVFCIIYFFVRAFSGAVRPKVSTLFAIGFEAILGVLMAAVILLPSVLAVSGNERLSSVLLGWNAITYGKEQIYLNIIECFFFPPDIPARPVFFPGADVKWSSLGGWLPLFSMTAVFTLFIHKKGSWLKRVIGICIFMALVPILNSSFYAFNTAYYARWYYMPILMMCLASAHLIEDKTVDFSAGFKWTLGITLGFALTIGLFPQKNSDGKLVFGLFTVDEDNTYLRRFWIAVIIAVLSLVLFRVLLNVRKKNTERFFKASTAFVCIISIVYSCVFIASGRTHSYDIENTMIKDLIEGEVYLDDDENFRIDTYDCVDNTGMFLGLPSINGFHSVVPSSISEFYDYLGVKRDVASRPDTDLPAIRPLLSVKYLLARIDGESFQNDNDTMKMPNYSYEKASGGFLVYKNENYVPFGFAYDYYFTEKDAKSKSGDIRSRMMLKGVLLDKSQAEKYKDILTNIKEREDLLPETYAETGIKPYSNAQMQADAEILRENSASSFKIDKKGFSATFNREKASLVFFSVPYDKGWSATVNGNPVTPEKVNKGFMAVVVPKGKSKVVFTYKTPGLTLGAEISLIGFVIFLIYFLSAKLISKKHPQNLEYPEGKMLLSKWRKSDIAEECAEELQYENESILSNLTKEEKKKEKTPKNKDNGTFEINTDIFDD